MNSKITPHVWNQLLVRSDKKTDYVDCS